MINLSRAKFPFYLKKKAEQLEVAFLRYLDDRVSLPADLKFYAFPGNFFDPLFYLVYPSLFKKAFGEKDHRFGNELCISGFFYFRYLLCLDAMNDKDTPEMSAGGGDAMAILKSHIYQQEAMKILGKLFGNNRKFWECWNKRNSEFLNSILMDGAYDLEMDLERYKRLSIYKCSISKVAADAYYVKYRKKHALYTSLLESIDHFSIARCIQDDLEDFRKDIIYRKNNLGHILLSKWLQQRRIRFEDQTPEMLEKYLFTSEIAEQLMQLSRDHYQQAMAAVTPYREQLGDYLNILRIGRNSMNFYKVNTHAYRIHKYVSKIIQPQPQPKTVSTKKAISCSLDYVNRMQNEDGSWYEISNMQGLSNVWATGFIGSFLEPGEASLQKAAGFLLQHQQHSLWGYNTDWHADYDSTTTALITLSKAQHPIEPYMGLWFKGQTARGGFSTYAGNQHAVSDNMGIRHSQLKGWTSTHTCVSALAYYLLSQLSDKQAYSRGFVQLKKYLLTQQDANGVWQPYWWTSYLYPTCFILQSLLRDSPSLLPAAEKGLAHVISQQTANGSYSCEMLSKESVFYTALVLDTVCASPKWARQYKKEAVKMKNWIVGQQYKDGGFPGSDFLVIPNPDAVKWNKTEHSFRINKSGGGNTITGEIASLFSTAVSLHALRRFQHLYS